MSKADWIINTTDQTFEQDVIAKSHQAPVVVDFWAEWCGPCRSLAPILEKLVGDYGGQITLVKANTEETPQAATQFSVSGIPAVFGVVGGEVVDGFQGALPESSIRVWLDKLLTTASLHQAHSLLETDPKAAEANLRTYLERSPRDADALAMLAEALLKQERLDECGSVIQTLEEQGPLDTRAQKVKAALDMQQRAGVDIDAVRAAAAADPHNWEKQLALAEALAGRQDFVEAFEICLNLVTRDRKDTGERARSLMVEVFHFLGDDSPLTTEYRRRLASVLY